MCGRFVQQFDDAQWQALLDAFDLPPAPAPKARYNVAPTQRICGVGWSATAPSQAARGNNGAALVPLVFGMAMAASRLVINARAETLTERAMFRPLVHRHRVLVVASAFYEWAPALPHEKSKRPHAIERVNNAPFCFAALKSARKEAAPGAVIVTTEANETIAPLHARMPVLLDAPQARKWLDPRTPLDEALALLRPFAWPLRARAVGRQVNNPRHDAPDCLQH